MDINFKDKKIQKICLECREAEKKLGTASAKKLRTRLSDIDSVDNVRELLAGRPHALERDRTGQYAVDLAGGKRLVFEPNHDPIPQNSAGKVDWMEVTAVTIVFIGDYHD